MNDLVRNIVLWTVIALVLLVAVRSFGPDTAGTLPSGEVTYSEFMQDVDQARVAKARMVDDGRRITYQTQDGSSKSVNVPPLHLTLPDHLIEKGVKFEVEKPSTGFSFVGLFMNLLPVLLIIGFWLFIMRQMQSGGGGRGASWRGPPPGPR